MVHLRILLFWELLHHILGFSVGVTFYPVDKWQSQFMVGGAQPSGLFFTSTCFADLTAGSYFNITATRPLFRTPSGNYSVQVNLLTKTGFNCMLDYTRGTSTFMSWKLSLMDGACWIPAFATSQFILPQDFAAVSPLASALPQLTFLVVTSTGGTSNTTFRPTYTSYATIYVTADPRNADNSSSELMGTVQPSFLNLGWTNTWNVTSGAVIQVNSSLATFRRPSVAYNITIVGTGCTAILTSTGTPTGPTNQLKFLLSGSSCRLVQNVPVAGSMFQLPVDLLTPNPVDATVFITVTFIEGNVVNSIRAGNPGSYTTTNNCSAWSDWSSCTATCEGTMFRTRTGDPSTCFTTIAMRPCSTISCACASWSSWGSCSATCNGTISRYRTGSTSSCNTSTVDTQSCSPSCDVSWWTQTGCSSSCGCGVRTRTVTNYNTSINASYNSTFDLVCNETFIPDSQPCSCVDLPWTDRFGSTCSDYVSNNWCTSSGDYGSGWDSSQPGFRSFDSRANNGQNALAACCGCGKNNCVKDTVLLVDQSGSIDRSDWRQMQRYMLNRVSQTNFTDGSGNRIGIVQFDVAAAVLCPLTWNQTFLLNCIRAITFPAGPGTATSAGLDLTFTVFDRYSNRNRTRVVEMLTDGSPNIPRGTGQAAAFASASKLKDTGVTILTIGMGVLCLPPNVDNCLNRDVLNTMASSPPSSYAVLLASYSSLQAMALFISSQCAPAQFDGFDPSVSPSPAVSPSPILLPSPSPTAQAQCEVQEALVPNDYMLQNIDGCNKGGVAYLLRQYECVELQPSCGAFQCSLHVPPSVIIQIQSICNSIVV